MNNEYFHNYYLKNKEKHLKTVKEYYLKNREKILERRRKLKIHLLPINKKNKADWNKRNPDKVKLAAFKSEIKTNYGISIEQYNTLMERQGDICKICGNKQIKGKRLSIDHSHSTGKIRGLLCHNCNVAIGLVKENTVVLQNMINYLEENKPC